MSDQQIRGVTCFLVGVAALNVSLGIAWTRAEHLEISDTLLP
jgi:hypothetical protein